MATAGDSLTELFDRIRADTEGEQVAVGDLLELFGQRAYGPMFAIVSLLALLPTGAIPGMSALTGAIMTLLSVQLMFGRSIWLPNVITKRTIDRDTLMRSLDKAQGMAERISKVIRPRFEVMANPPLINILGGLSVLISLSMFPLVLVPFGAFPAGLSLLVVGLGLTARDGLLLASGLVIGVVGVTVAYVLAPI